MRKSRCNMQTEVHYHVLLKYYLNHIFLFGSLELLHIYVKQEADCTPVKHQLDFFFASIMSSVNLTMFLVTLLHSIVSFSVSTNETKFTSLPFYETVELALSIDKPGQLVFTDIWVRRQILSSWFVQIYSYEQEYNFAITSITSMDKEKYDWG